MRVFRLVTAATVVLAATVFLLVGLTALPALQQKPAAGGPRSGQPGGSGPRNEQGPDANSWQVARRRMVDTQIAARGVRDPGVLLAMARVARHLFVPLALRDHAYEDRPLPIGLDQTISQPYIVAYMTEALATARDQTVLEIGTGSGYQAAVLAELVREVLTIEIIPELAERARRALAKTGYGNVQVRTGNGYLGWPERAPFARIIVTAAPETIPQALVDQLAVGGIMVLPVGRAFQEMTIVTKTALGVTERRSRSASCRWSTGLGSPRVFVPSQEGQRAKVTRD